LAERHVAGISPVDLGDQRNPRVACGPQGIDERRFAVTAKARQVTSRTST
jgi:hypothetical protein